MARVLIACECSGTVRDRFIALGHDAISCDLEPTDVAGPHYQGDVRDILNDDWDLIIAHPPCTYLSVSGNRWMYEQSDRYKKQLEAIKFFKLFLDSKCHKVGIENPVSIISSIVGPANQCIQPWMFGDGYSKRTCLWLKNLPHLIPTKVVRERKQEVWRMSPGPLRAKIRSKTYPGIAWAMAKQWGAVINAK